MTAPSFQLSAEVVAIKKKCLATRVYYCVKAAEGRPAITVCDSDPAHSGTGDNIDGNTMLK